MEEKKGSVRYEEALKNGYIEGVSKYASYAPHHSRGEGGAWNYVNMYHRETEEKLRKIFETKKKITLETDSLIWNQKTEKYYYRREAGSMGIQDIEIDEKLILEFTDNGENEKGIYAGVGIIGRE